MAKTLIIGILVFLVLVTVRVPAGLLRSLIPDSSPATLLDLTGTIWNGSGDLLIEGNPIGRLDWTFLPARLLKASVGYDLALEGEGIALEGVFSSGPGSSRAEAEGTVAADFVNRWLAPYYIKLSGTFELSDISVGMDRRRLESLSGVLNWDGGPLEYKLSGNMRNSVLPPMMAELGPGMTAVAYAEGESIPLLQAELKTDGFARVGVTKYLTRILGEPWPGGDPDHAVVLEVEEQVF